LLLRASGESEGIEYELGAARDSTRDSGVAHGAELLAFADAVLGRDDAALERARERLAAAMGDAAIGDAAAIVAAFQFVDRVADATGIPLDAVVDVTSQDVQRDLGLREFGSASNTPSRAIARAVGSLLTPFRSALMRVASHHMR
jgi:hypothetical protein